jgi:glycerol-3-phosphate dehydrogenase (NAD(P)+)
MIGRRFLVIGAGAWGTALAMLLARNQCPTDLWSNDPAQIDQMLKTRENSTFLPDLPFPEHLQPLADLNLGLQRADVILIAVPSEAFRIVLAQLTPFLSQKKLPLAWATKGLEHGTGMLLNQVVAQTLGENYPIAVISGPTFAAEVAKGLPAAMTVAANDPDNARNIAESLHNSSCRVYTSHDVIGVQIGGAAKNIIAIAAGIADGLGFGANTRAALITRGLTEIVRLGLAMGGQLETFMGLTGLGDLVLTCTDNQSRNRRFGYALAQYNNVEQARNAVAQTVEGIFAAEEVVKVSQQLGIEMPITTQVHAVLQGHCTPKEAVFNLLSREPKAEH